jgi:hypothetical protein
MGFSFRVRRDAFSLADLAETPALAGPAQIRMGLPG